MANNDTSKLVYTQVEYSHSGGVSSMAYGKVILDHCKINNNHGIYGAGVEVGFIPIKISYCEIDDNHASIYGGGVFVSTTGTLSSSIDHNNTHNNVADGAGGGFYFMNVNNISFTWNTSQYNYAPYGSGGFLMLGGPTLTNNIFCNNTTPPAGSGTLYIENCTANIMDNLFANNSAYGIVCINASPNLVNNTIVNNNGNFGSGIFVNNNADPHIKNCIIYGNVANNPIYGNQITIGDANSTPFFDHCDIQDGLTGIGGPGSSTYPSGNYTNNITSLPQFINGTPGAGAGYDGLSANWQEQSTSLCINAGDTTGVSILLPAVDLAGNPRINTIIDMGTYEYLCAGLPVSVTISASSNPVCSGTTVNFTATPVNGGSTPSFQWKKNGTNTGTNLPTYSYIPVNGDIITCVVTSSLTCTTGSPATSIAITMTVNTSLPVSVSITASQNPVCPGTTGTFTATPVNGGTAPVYQWKKNGTNTGPNLPTYSYIPVNGDVITCVVTSSLTCTTGNPATSNAITMVVNPLPGATGPITGPASPCEGSSVGYSIAAVSNATGYLWTIPSGWTLNSGQNTTTINVTAGAAGGNVTVTASNSCGNSNTPTLAVAVLPLPGSAGSISGPASVCQNSTGLVYSISAVSNSTGYVWTAPPGWTITSGQNTTSIAATAGTSGGNITLTANNSCGNSNTAVLAVGVNAPPVANAGADQNVGFGASATLNGSASGGSGSYGYHWEPAVMFINPNIQYPVTVALTSSQLFTLTVTDASGCTGTDQVLVTVTGGVLSVHATASPDPSCAGNMVQLMAITGGGTGNYSYSWSSNPPGFTASIPNPAVYPVFTTTYIVTVNDGFTTVTDSVDQNVNPLVGIPVEPVGPDTVDLKSTVSSVFTTNSAFAATSFFWELQPTGAGVISGNDTVGTVAWNPNYLGLAHIRVKAMNGCGESQWSQDKITFVDNTTGVMTHTMFDVMIYPNPNDGLFFIRSSEPLLKVRIFDITGNSIAQIVRPVKDYPFDYRQLPSGVYFVHIAGLKIDVVRSFILSH